MAKTILWVVLLMIFLIEAGLSLRVLIGPGPAAGGDPCATQAGCNSNR